jgi:putative ABC transport system substrate-binding protein
MHRRTFLPLLGGPVAYWPFAAWAQRSPAVIGYLNSASPASYPAALLAAFRQGLGETGYMEGKNLAIEYRWAENRYDRLPELARQLVERPVAVIAATGGLVTALAAKNATTIVPIVFSMGDDPVLAEVVTSFSRPGGNITGVSFFVLELGTKLLDLATELLPGADRIALLANPSRPSYPAIRDAIEGAARTKGRGLVILDAASEKDFQSAFVSLAQAQANALLVTSDPLYLDRRERLVGLAASHAVPTIYAWREYVSSGGLMSYGPSLPDAYRQVGIYVGKILGGTKAADLPIAQPTKFELVINLKAAQALGLTVPPSLLARADEVIE